MKKLRTRLIFDAVLTALLAFEMFFEMTGDTLHEIIGAVFFATIIAHLAFSRKWIGAMAKATAAGRRMKPMATARMVLGILLSISMVALMASSVAISNLLAGAGLDLAGAAYGTWSLVHTVSAYALCCLVVAHLGIHWASIASALKIPYNPERRGAISTGVTALGALGVAAIGLAGYKSVAKPASLAIVESAAAKPTDVEFEVSDIPYKEPAGESSSTAASDKSKKQAEKQTKKRNTNSTESGKGSSAEKSSSELSAADGSGVNSNTSSYDDPELYDDSDSLDDWDSYADSKSYDDWGSDSDSDSYEDSDSNSTDASGTCTLCHKNCSLSAPQCNRPYEAGLL